MTGDATLRSLFVDFQANSSRTYVRNLISATAAAAGRPVPFSANNGGRWPALMDEFDYGMGELSQSAANPGALVAIFVTAPRGKPQIMTMPKPPTPNVTAADVRLTRVTIGFAYALGQHLMVHS